MHILFLKYRFNLISRAKMLDILILIMILIIINYLLTSIPVNIPNIFILVNIFKAFVNIFIIIMLMYKIYKEITE